MKLDSISSLVSKAQSSNTATEDVPMTPIKDSGASSSSKILNVLDMFSVERPTLHVDDVSQAFDVSQSTAYRYLKELSDAGFLAQLGKGAYSLGPKIVELERLLRLTDPLFIAGTIAMANLKDQCENRALLLCTLYKDRVLCIQRAGADTIQMGDESMPTMRDRGTPFALFKGAGSLAILAHLPLHKIKSLYLSNQKEITEAGLGESWKDFRNNLSNIRKNGYAMTVGRVNNKILGFAVPIILSSAEVAGSLLVLTQNTDEERTKLIELLPKLKGQADMISQHVMALQQPR